jgi:hypothetical protein
MYVVCSSFPFQITYVGFTHTVYNIRKLSKLRHLRLAKMPNINNKCMETITLPALQSFNLTRCRKVSLEGVKTVILQNPLLEILLIIDVLPPIHFKKGKKFAKTNLKRFKRAAFHVDEVGYHI